MFYLSMYARGKKTGYRRFEKSSPKAHHICGVIASHIKVTVTLARMMFEQTLERSGTSEHMSSFLYGVPKMHMAVTTAFTHIQSRAALCKRASHLEILVPDFKCYRGHGFGSKLVLLRTYCTPYRVLRMQSMYATQVEICKVRGTRPLELTVFWWRDRPFRANHNLY